MAEAVSGPTPGIDCNCWMTSSLRVSCKSCRSYRVTRIIQTLKMVKKILHRHVTTMSGNRSR